MNTENDSSPLNGIEHSLKNDNIKACCFLRVNDNHSYYLKRIRCKHKIYYNTIVNILVYLLTDILTIALCIIVIKICAENEHMAI